MSVVGKYFSRSDNNNAKPNLRSNSGPQATDLERLIYTNNK
jgi:hypothetical protein